VLDIFPRAGDVESDSGNQTALIEAKSNMFQTFIRSVHKDWLETPYDEVVKLAVAHLVADELHKRRLSDDSDLEPADFDHISGKFTDSGIMAHSLIQSIRSSAIVLTQDDAERDLRYPEPVVIAQTGTSKPLVYVPFGYRGATETILTIEITTTGRVEDSTAVWKAYWDYADDDPAVSAETCSGEKYDMGSGVYVLFKDVATTGNSYASGDKYDVKLVPQTAEVRSTGPKAFDMYTS
jgi:hypothetical protein